MLVDGVDGIYFLVDMGVRSSDLVFVHKRFRTEAQSPTAVAAEVLAS